MAYQNAVSDKLTLLSYPDRVSLLISSKTGTIKYYLASLSEVDVHEVKALLSASIFAKTRIVQCNCPFVLCPAHIDPIDQQIYFNQSYPESGPLVAQHINDEIDLIQPIRELPFQIEQLLVNVEHINDIGLLHEYKHGLSRTNSIYFSVIDQALSIRVYSAGFLVLANRFAAQSKDDIFYFIMLAVEELKLDMNAMHFEFIGDPKDYTDLKSMFANYLPMLLQLPSLEVDSQLEGEQQALFNKDWFAKLAVQCG